MLSSLALVLVIMTHMHIMVLATYDAKTLIKEQTAQNRGSVLLSHVVDRLLICWDCRAVQGGADHFCLQR